MPRIASQLRLKANPGGFFCVPAEVTEARGMSIPVVHAVHDRPGPRRIPALEEPWAGQEDREGVADQAQAGGEHHVADLRSYRRCGERL